MIEVEVPGKGVAEFPDGSNPRDMEHAVFSTWPELADTPLKQKKAQLLALRDKALGGVTMPEMQQAVSEGLEEELTKPFFPIPRPGKLEPSPETPIPPNLAYAIHAGGAVADTVIEKLLSAVEGIETPISGVLAATGTVAPRLVAGAVGLMGAGQVAQGVKEAAKGVSNKDLPQVAGGITDIGLGGAMAGLGAKGAMGIPRVTTDVAPMTAEVLRERTPEVSDQVKTIELPAAATQPELKPQTGLPTETEPGKLHSSDLERFSSPIRENRARTSLILSDGTAIIGGRIHAQTYSEALRIGAATEDQLQSSRAAFTRPDGVSWDLQGKPIEVKRIVNLSEASAGVKALTVGEETGPITRSTPPPAKAEKGAHETATALKSKPPPSSSETVPQTKAPAEPSAVSEASKPGESPPGEAPAISQATTEGQKAKGAAQSVTFTEPNPEPNDISSGPGAASPGQLGQRTDISELTESLKGTTPTKVPISEQVKNAYEATAKQLKSGWENALATLRSNGQAALQALIGTSPWTDFKAALGKFSGDLNRNDFDLIQFTHEIKRAVPDPVRREAIVNWLQAGGDTALLASRAAASKEAFRKGYERAMDLTPDELVVAGNVRQYLDSKLQEGMDAGLLKAGVENYVSQLWDRPNPVTQKLLSLASTGRLQPDFKFARQRIFDSYFEGEQAGYTPRVKDIGALVSIYDQSFSRAIAARQWLKSMHEGVASDGRPLVEVSGVAIPVVDNGSPSALLIKPKVKTSEIGDYRPVDHPAMRGWKWAGTDQESGAPVLYQGDLLVHPEVWRNVKNALGTSKLRQYGLTKTILEAQALLKQSKLALSGFHFTQEGVHAMAHRVNPLAPRPIDFTDPVQTALVDHGLEVANYRAYQAFTEGISGSGSIYERVPVVGKWLSRYNEYLFQEYIPRLKMSMAMDALQRNRERYGKVLNEDQLHELTANESNAAFGELNYVMLGRNPTLQDFLRLGALAPDFLEARGRFAAQAFTRVGGEQRSALALQGATLYVAARLLNQYLDKDPHWKPRDAFSIFVNGRQYGLRSVVGDIGHLISDPGNFIGNRIAPLSKAAIEFVSGGRNWKGEKRTAFEQAKDLADWLLPISLDKQIGHTRMDQVLGASGVTVRSATPIQRINKLLQDYKADQSLMTKEEKEGMVASSDYAPLRAALEIQDNGLAKKEYDKLLNPTDKVRAKTAAQVRDYFAAYPKRPFSGSAKIEHAFVNSLSDHDRELYLSAVQERKNISMRFATMQREMQTKTNSQKASQ